MNQRDNIIRLLHMNTRLTDEEIEQKADALLVKGILGSRDVALLFGTKPSVVSIWARRGRIPGAFKPNTEWMFMVDRLPTSIRVNNSGRGGLPDRVKEEIDKEDNGQVSARSLSEKYNVSRTYIYDRRKELNKQPTTE